MIKKHFLKFFCCFLLGFSYSSAAETSASKSSLFSNTDITTSYSELLQEKNARNDSLLPALDGDKALAEVLRRNPNLWSFETIGQEKGVVLTKLKAQIIYIDGIREEPFCELDKQASNTAGEWSLKIGIDFVSGGSNTVDIHVRQCFNMVRDELGYQIQQGEKIVTVPPKKVIDEIKENEIPEVLDYDLQQKLLATSENVELSGKCPKDIESYLMLREVWEQVQNEKMDIFVINEKLNRQVNGGKSVQSCAFSREWNKKYQEYISFECNIDEDYCDYKQSENGESTWLFNFDAGRFEYKKKKFLFFTIGKKSIHDGGTMMDLRIVRLSSNLFLESYLNEKGEPVSLGLLIVPEDDEDEWEYYDEDEAAAETDSEVLER